MKINESQLEELVVLLKLTYEILKKCDQSVYMLDVMAQEAHIDNYSVDGHGLMNDIKDTLFEIGEIYVTD